MPESNDTLAVDTPHPQGEWGFTRLSKSPPTIEGLPLGWVEAVYASLRELGLIYLDRHWRLNGQELTDLLARSLAPTNLAKAFHQTKGEHQNAEHF